MDLEKVPNSFKIVQIIKCVNQEMPVAAIAAMKQRIGSKAPYKDIRGTWHIEVGFPSFFARCLNFFSLISHYVDINI